VAGESISIPILTPGANEAARNIKQVGNASAETAGKLDVAAASLALWNTTAAKSAKTDATLVASKRAHAKADALAADAERVLGGEATKTTKLFADQGRELDRTGAKTRAAASGFSLLTNNASLSTTGMGALIGVGVALSPVIATVGVGLTGLAAAAYGVAKPIANAAQKAGGLQKNMASLDAEQRTVARGILGLGKQYNAFQSGLKPEILGAFNQGIRIAGHLLHDVQPVAAATGKALNTVLGSIDREFQSGTWQQFFAFMARTAGPDIQLLGKNFTDLMQALPPLIEDLQPLAHGLLIVSDDAVQAADHIRNFYDSFQRNVPISNVHTINFLKDLDRWTVNLTNHLGGRAINDAITGFQHWVTGTGDAAKPAAASVRHLSMVTGDLIHPLATAAAQAGIFGDTTGQAATGVTSVGAQSKTAVPKVWSLTTAVAALNASMTTLVGNLLTLQGSNVTWRQSMQAAKHQLDSNTAGLAGNSRNALANKQAVIASTQAALSFAQQELTTGKDIGGASRTVEAQIRFLQGLHDKSAFVRAEIKALRKEEQLLQAQRMNQLITVHGKGTWSVVGTGRFAGKPTGFTGGGLLRGGIPGQDSIPILAMPGEAVVPRHLTPAVAPFLKAHGVPGFAAGGIVPAYSGSAGGLKPWVAANDQATIRLIDMAVARATLAGLRSFGGGFPGGRGGLGVAERAWMGAGGPGGILAHIAGAIAGAESGWTMAIQKGQPYATTGWGPWQITPGNSEPQFGTDYALLNWRSNALAAVAKYRQAGGSFSPWTTFTSGAYTQFMDSGGWLRPGWNPPMYNGTGHPEHLVPARAHSGGNTYNINVNVPPSANKADIGRQVVETIREFEKRSGAGWRR
jgi:hypothetical protein